MPRRFLHRATDRAPITCAVLSGQVSCRCDASPTSRRYGFQQRGELMSVRKRTWKNAKGEPQEAWIVDYVDQKGKRHIETFARKKDADARHAVVKVDVSKGTH